MSINILEQTDSYKVSHWKQYPKGTEHVISYLESRSEGEDIVFFGLQYILKMMEGTVITQKQLDDFVELMGATFAHDYVNVKGWQYIIDNYDGNLPLMIHAVPEGTIVPSGNVLMTIRNTDPKCFWLTNYVESLLMNVWMPITRATQTYNLYKYMKDNYDYGDMLPFTLTDFSVRSAPSPEAGAIGGMAHLLCFKGTDNIPAMSLARKVYDAPIDVAASVAAAEHSTIISYGRDKEVEAYRRIIESVPDEALISIVADSYDIWNAIDNIFGGELRELIENRAGRTVVRPDSGNPIEVSVKVLQHLDKVFGSTELNGLKLLNSNVGVIYGDGINYNTIPQIIDAVKEAGYHETNIVFGAGGGLFNEQNRDTYKFAIKCSAVVINNKYNVVSKCPIDGDWKKSKKGTLNMIRTSDGTYKTIDVIEGVACNFDEYILRPIFYNGIIKKYKWSDIISNMEK